MQHGRSIAFCRRSRPAANDAAEPSTINATVTDGDEMNPTCKFCGTMPNGDDKSCSSKDAALRCAWLSRSEREQLLRPPTVREALISLNVELDTYWSGNRSDEQIKRICAAQMECRKALGALDNGRTRAA